MLIEQLENMGADDPNYFATFTVLGEYVRHHVREEQDEMFPAVQEGRARPRRRSASGCARAKRNWPEKRRKPDENSSNGSSRACSHCRRRDRQPRGERPRRAADERHRACLRWRRAAGSRRPGQAQYAPELRHSYRGFCLVGGVLRTALALQARPRRLLTAVTLSAIAYVVDYYVVSKRFRPGFEVYLAARDVRGLCRLGRRLPRRQARAQADIVARRSESGRTSVKVLPSPGTARQAAARRRGAASARG